jgi:hypothetical protein
MVNAASGVIFGGVWWSSYRTAHVLGHKVLRLCMVGP